MRFRTDKIPKAVRQINQNGRLVNSSWVNTHLIPAYRIAARVKKDNQADTEWEMAEEGILDNTTRPEAAGTIRSNVPCPRRSEDSSENGKCRGKIPTRRPILNSSGIPADAERSVKLVLNPAVRLPTTKVHRAIIIPANPGGKYLDGAKMRGFSLISS